MKCEVSIISSHKAILGEGALWHPEENRIYWVDIEGGLLMRCAANGSDFEIALEAGPIGGLTLHTDGSLVLLMEQGAVRVWKNGLLKEVVAPDPTRPNTRWNDAIVDLNGRIYTGTIQTNEFDGILRQLNEFGNGRTLRDGIGCSNGMGFSPDESVMYHTDSHALEIRRYDFDAQSSELSNERCFASFKIGDGLPDGLAVDEAGCVWSAFWGGGCIRRISPSGEILTTIELPASRVTSIAFGGPDGTDMFITSAAGHDSLLYGLNAGNLFRINLGIKGRKLYRARLQY